MSALIAAQATKGRPADAAVRHRNLSSDRVAAIAERYHRVPPGPGRPAALPHAPVNSNAGPDQLAAVCADLRPGIPLLAMAYPEFAIIGPAPGRNGPAWAVIRKDPAQPGLYAVVTPDLAELRDILARHASNQPGGTDSGT